MSTSSPIDQPLPTRSLGWLTWLTALGIIYGSLLPFEYRAIPLDQAVDIFRHIKWLDLDIESRADWVANLILYLPFGFSTCGALSRTTLAGAILLALLLGTFLAVSVEFAQIWAAPRTVSLNDIVAEIAGTGLGALAWSLGGRMSLRVMRSARAGGPDAVSAAFGLYVLAYAFLALFPFDFLVSRSEINARLADPNAIVWIPQDYFTVRGLGYLILKSALMAPLGVAARVTWHLSIRNTILAAMMLSGALEIGHWFEYSAKVDGISIAIAIVGATFGYIVANSLRETILRVIPWLRVSIWLAVPVYLASLPVMRGWHYGYVSRTQIEGTITSLNWLPFYYHYFTSEQNALASMLHIAASYAPIGALVWAIGLRHNEPGGQSRPLVWSALVAAVLAVIMEAGGLITAGLRPDPTNVLIAASAATLAQRICEWTARIVTDALSTRNIAR